MNKFNFSFISLTRKVKWVLASFFIILLILVLTYIYIFEIIDVISKEYAFSYLVPINVSHLKDVCPLNYIDKSDSMQYLSISGWSGDANSNAEKFNISLGGEWQPSYCVSRFLVAIIVPYRAREKHLREFIFYIHPFVQTQNVHYKLYVIEQGNDKHFNRGKLFNVGFIEALKDNPFPCFIFHDVDLLPVNKNNIYACTTTPRHMSAAIDKFQYSPPYYRNFGGVLSILADQFKLVNGFSNEFFGWGGEDDDFYNRIRNALLRPLRFDFSISQYHSLQHEPAIPNERRFDVMNVASKSNDKDGLISTQYSVLRRLDEPLFTRIVVDL